MTLLAQLAAGALAIGSLPSTPRSGYATGSGSFTKAGPGRHHKQGRARKPGPAWKRYRLPHGPGTISEYDAQVRAWLEGGRVGARPKR